MFENRIFAVVLERGRRKMSTQSGQVLWSVLSGRKSVTKSAKQVKQEIIYASVSVCLSIDLFIFCFWADNCINVKYNCFNGGKNPETTQRYEYQMETFRTLGFRMAGEMWGLWQPLKWYWQSDMDERGCEFLPRGSSWVMVMDRGQESPLFLPAPPPLAGLEPCSDTRKGWDQKLQEGLFPKQTNNVSKAEK